jgi:hypothetical protein
MGSPPPRLPLEPKPPQPVNAPKEQPASTTDGVAGLGGETEIVELSRGKELSETAAIALAASRPIHWIVLAGPIDSGKTTLLASLYELLQWAPVDGFAFAGSNTLPAFEERCFLSRRNSGNEEPDTERTSYKGPDPQYLHLRVRSVEGLRPFVDFLFTDVSGELFEHACNSTAECKEMLFLKRASNLLVLLDSEKAVQRDNRWAVVEEARQLLRSCVDSEMIAPDCAVNIVWSRFDYFAAVSADKGHQTYREEVEKQLRASFGNHISNLSFSELAARPMKAPDLKFAHGVPALLKQWGITSLARKSLELLPKSFSGTRESELFAERHFASLKDNEEPNK